MRYLSKMSGVLEHIQRNIEFTLDRSVVDISHHPLNPIVVLRVRICKGMLEWSLGMTGRRRRAAPSHHHGSDVGPMQERGNVPRSL